MFQTWRNPEMNTISSGGGTVSAPTPSSNWKIGGVKCCGGTTQHTQLGANYFSAVGAWELTLEDGHPSPEWSSAIPATDESSCEVGALVSALEHSASLLRREEHRWVGSGRFSGSFWTWYIIPQDMSQGWSPRDYTVLKEEKLLRNSSFLRFAWFEK